MSGLDILNTQTGRLTCKEAKNRHTRSTMECTLKTAGQPADLSVGRNCSEKLYDNTIITKKLDLTFECETLASPSIAAPPDDYMHGKCCPLQEISPSTSPEMTLKKQLMHSANHQDTLTQGA